MSSWTKVKGLFWQGGTNEQPSDEALTDAEFQELLSSEHAVPPHAVEPVDPSTVTTKDAGGTLFIDFQAQYDVAGIPNTDEVEQLERFLNGLDANLPQASRLAAAKAFLGAVGKSVEHVQRDAELKIERVRAILAGKEQATSSSLSAEEVRIQELTAEIEAHRAKIQELTGELEGVRRACLVEESRLQAARVFFGNVQGT
jgi:hypothetical protein